MTHPDLIIEFAGPMGDSIPVDALLGLQKMLDKWLGKHCLVSEPQMGKLGGLRLEFWRRRRTDKKEEDV